MMQRSFAICLSLFLVVQVNVLRAELRPEQGKGGEGRSAAEERATQLFLEFKKSLSKGSVGRFHAVRMDNSAVVILDTKQAHLWVFGSTGSGFYLVYGGQAYPGQKAGEIIDSSSLRLRKGESFGEVGRPEP